MKDPQGMVGAGLRLASSIERLNDCIGRITAWLTLAMVLGMVAVVVIRYAFGSGVIWLTESITWMHGLVFMLGAAYALGQDAHVRVDVFYRGWSDRGRAWVNLAGTVLLLLPFCGWVLHTSLPYVAVAWSIHETSREAGGLPALYLLKSLIPATALLLALQGIALVLRSAAALLADRAGTGR